MNRKLITALAALTTTLCLLPPAAHAVDTTTSSQVPTACLYTPANPTGPSRAVHSPAQHTAGAALPDCSTIAGICVVFQNVGPSRGVHQPAGTILLPPDPCEGINEACQLHPDLAGPARAIHQRPAHAFPVQQPITVDITIECQAVLAAMIPTTGSDTGHTVWLATGFLLAGAVLVFGVRRVAHR